MDDEATLFGFPLGKSNLSDGQKVLLQLCLAIYSQDTKLKDLILILDEPENHLHPSVIVETVEKIRECTSNGQIWIATHSVALLSHFDPSLIWYVDEGKIRHGGRIPEKVLRSLLGDDNQIAKLQDFISLPSQFATIRYAFESLVAPRVVETDHTDPQTNQIRDNLLKASQSKKLRVLDFGAGKGRLLSNIIDLDEREQQTLLTNIEYIAYDKFDDDKDFCMEALGKIYDHPEQRYFNSFEDLFSRYDRHSFDVVMLCNVLHEIDPKEWIGLFKEQGVIPSLLSDTGELILVEDHQIPVGEKAYQKGFLVLDTAHLNALFKITEQDTNFRFSYKDGRGRLKAHHIPRNCLERIDNDSRCQAIQAMSETDRGKILDIRSKEQTYKNGILHGFWTQQFANAQLNLAEFA